MDEHEESKSCAQLDRIPETFAMSTSADSTPEAEFVGLGTVVKMHEIIILAHKTSFCTLASMRKAMLLQSLSSHRPH